MSFAGRRDFFLAPLLFTCALAACSGSTAPPAAGTSGAQTESPSDQGGPSPADGTSGSSGATGSSGGRPTPPVNSAWSAAKCAAPTGKVGFAVGESIGDLGVKDCVTGATATIDEVCGAGATWIFAAHTHCPTCQATASFTDDVAAAVASKNVAIVHIVYDDNGTSCAKWRDAYKLAGLANVRVYADPDGSVWGRLKTSSYTAPSAFLDKNRVVTYREHGLDKAEVLSQIDSALAK